MNEVEETEIFVVKTTANQERSVANLIDMMAKKEALTIRAILAPDELKVEHFLTPKTAVVGITEGSIVELISGPFKGEKARVKRVDETHEEITVELFEAMVPIPITVRGDNVRVLKREEQE
jgi:transcriptional antiterminator NusG